jgi:2-oxoglutarate dehydrogenase E1 component
VLSQLKGYTTGGTIHIVINNQIGFTTAPQFSRSGTYCSDVAKMVQAPIFHVNGDDVEAVVHVARIATEYRQTFKADVVLDMVCYRRHGHNESDEPAFTQPIMYKKIAAHPTTREVYARKLVSDGTLSKAETDEIYDRFNSRLELEYQAAKSYKVNKADWLEGKWTGFAQAQGEEEFREEPTLVAIDNLKRVGAAICKAPENFATNPKVLRQLEQKRKMIEGGTGIDWATAEALAFGTLLDEGIPVRLSGQDCGRGTFSQRHAVLTDQENEKRHVPLSHIRPGQSPFEVLDSPLSELAVLGFEYGYSLSEPNTLTLWEGQFGDFANGAQAIFDQFISSAESKWLRMSGLVVLLPHGAEGQGPEHSSARWERYLQLCAEDNMQVANCTTPANYFHILRRQIKRNFRKPLIIMTPKSLLRHKLCVSKLSEMGPSTKFHRVLPETEKLAADKSVKRVVLCSGKVYYDLLEERTRREIKDVALVRVEQLYPWPKAALVKELSRYKNADIVWCQEEPANMGPWTFVDRRLEFVMEEAGSKAKRPLYVGRKAAASPATGLYKTHNLEQAQLVEQALTWEEGKIPQPFRRVSKLGI